MAVREPRESYPAKIKEDRVRPKVAIDSHAVINDSVALLSEPSNESPRLSFEQRFYERVGLSHVLNWISKQFGDPTPNEIARLDRSSLQGIRLKTHYVEVGCLYKTSFYLPPLAVAMTSGDAFGTFLISIPTGGYVLLALVERYQRLSVVRALKSLSSIGRTNVVANSEADSAQIVEDLQNRGAVPEDSFMGFYFRLQPFETTSLYERFGFDKFKNWVETESEKILARYSEPNQSLSLHKFERPSRSEVLKFAKRASQNEAAHLIGIAMNVPIFLRFLLGRTMVGTILMAGYIAVDAGLSFIQRYNRVRITTSRLYLRAKHE